jgi:hypothetical protein
VEDVKLKMHIIIKHIYIIEYGKAKCLPWLSHGFLPNNPVWLWAGRVNLAQMARIPELYVKQKLHNKEVIKVQFPNHQ